MIKKWKFRFRVLFGLCILLLILIVGFILFPAPVFRAAFAQIEAQTDIDLTFENVYFSYDIQKEPHDSHRRGRLVFQGLAVKRQNQPDINFDLNADTVQFAFFPFRFRHSTISGLRGTVERVSNPPLNEEEPNPEMAMNNDFVEMLRLNKLEDVELDFIDRTLDKPFQTTIYVDNFSILTVDTHPAIATLFTPYFFEGLGQIDSASIWIRHEPQSNIHQQVRIIDVPFTLFAPYAPVLDDIFIDGTMDIQVDDISNATQKKIRISLMLQQNCRIRPVNEIRSPAIQAALHDLDHSALPALSELKEKIDRLRHNSDALQSELDKVTEILDILRALAPRDVRERYDRFKAQYDRALADYNEWNGRLNTLIRELDQVKFRIIEETFQRFIESGIPIIIELQEVDGNWQFDPYAMVIRLIEDHYQTIVAVEYQKHIQDIRNAVDRLLQ